MANKEALAFATLVPGAAYVAAGAVWSSKSTGLKQFFESAKKPVYAVQNLNSYYALDVLTLAPAAYGAYLVYDQGGFIKDDTKLAGALYAASNAFVVATLPLYVKRDLGKMVQSMVVLNALQLATLLAFYAVDKRAGLLYLPVFVWTGFCNAVMQRMADIN